MSVTANPLKLDLSSHIKCVAICCIVTLASFQYGLDYALVGGFLSMPGFLQIFGYYSTTTNSWAINATVQQLISSLMTIGTFVGSLLLGPFSAKLGRRWGLWTASVLCCVSTIIMMATTNVGALYFARFILGVAVGWFISFAQLYVYEASPAHLRGVSLGLYQVMLSCGSVVGSAIDKGTSTLPDRRAYQIPLGIFFIVPVLQSAVLIFFPESPRWLMVQGRTEEAADALRRLRNSKIDPAQLKAELNTIQRSTEEQIANNSGHPWLEMWRGTNLRRTLLCLAVICFHCGNGSSWVNIYTTYFFTVAGIPAKEAFSYSILVTCTGLIGVLFSTCIVRYLNRKTILFWGCLACGFCQLVPAIAWSVSPGSATSGKLVVAFIALFTFSYTGYTPYAWLVGGEIVNNTLRPTTFGLATALNFLGNWLGTFTAPYFINPAVLNWSAKYGYIWFGSNMIMALFVLLFLPETKDRTLEEIHEMFEARLPAREFKNYVCEKTSGYAAEGVDQVHEKNGSTVPVEQPKTEV